MGLKFRIPPGTLVAMAPKKKNIPHKNGKSALNEVSARKRFAALGGTQPGIKKIPHRRFN